MQPNLCTTQRVQQDMAESSTSGSPSGRPNSPPQRNNLPPEIIAIIWPALQFGALSGVSGLLVGSISGVVKSTTPTLFAIASGIQWFTLGSTFWAARGLVLHTRDNKSNEPHQMVLASAIAGGVGGSVGGLLRSRRNVIPGAIMFSIFGAVGQTIYNRADARHAAINSAPTPISGNGKTWLDSKWSPVKVLSDDEYETMLKEKLLRVNAEIALVDESIDGVKKHDQDALAGKGGKE